MTSSVDILAKLLATENINIIRTNSTTASFNIRDRVLNLPKWKNMSPQVEEMLIMHEVGHALYTTNDGYLKELSSLKKVIAQYANVIEDVRIERKIKELYPGCRRGFFLGYKELNDRDFFEVKGKDLKNYILIDKINLYYKVGYNCGVNFTEEERKFLLRIEKCETEKEVVDLAQEIYEFSKKEVQEKAEKIKALFSDDIQDEEEYDPLDDEDEFGMSSSYDDEDEDEEDEDDSKSDSNSYQLSDKNDEDQEDSELESKTYNAVKDKLENLSDENSCIVYVSPEFYIRRDDPENIIVPYKNLLEEIKHHCLANNITDETRAAFIKQNADSNKVVSYLLKEFEMKKAATAYKYAKISKLGQLDTRKLYAYKLKDDIFKQVTKTKDGKKHGMVFLLDWSGSMDPYMEETIEQVVNLSMFCHRAQIPFQVFAFSDRFSHYCTHHAKLYGTKLSYNQAGIGCQNNFSLLELFSDKMSNSEMTMMIKYLSVRYFLPPSMQLGGTPLNDVLVYMVDYIGKFKRNNSVEKMSFISLTDGEGANLTYGREADLTYGKKWTSEGKFVNTRAYLRDPITKKEYQITRDSSSQTAALMSLIKDRYDCKNLNFLVVKNTYREINRFYTNNYTSHNLRDIQDIRVSIKSNGYSIMKNVPGRDEFYLLDSKKLNIEDGSFENLDSNSNSRQIAKSFLKVMNTRKTSRIVLNSFISQIS